MKKSQTLLAPLFPLLVQANIRLRCQGQMAWAALIKWSRVMVHITSRSNPNIQTIFQQFVKLQDRLHSSIAARWEAGSWSAECPSTDQSCQSDWLDSRDKMTWVFAYRHQLILRHDWRRTYHATSLKISILLCLYRRHHVSVNCQLFP